MDYRDADGISDTKSHQHVEQAVPMADGSQVTFDELAIRWGLYDSNGKPDSEMAKEMYLEEQRKEPDKEPQEIVDEISDRMEEQMPSNPRR